MNIEAVMGVIHVGLKVLSKHVLCFVALIMTFALFCWAMWLGTQLSLWAAGIFGGVIFLPVLARSIVPGRDNEQQSN